MVAEEAGLPFEEVFPAMHSFMADPTLGGYDYEAHVKSYGLDPETMWRKLAEERSKASYLYPDSASFIQSARAHGYDPKILSFGEKRFQTLKITPSLPELVGGDSKPLEVTIVDRKKHQHIRELHPGQRGVLIDDVPNQELPEGFTEIHIDRTLQLPHPVKKDGGFTIANLAQALEVLAMLQALST